MNYNKMKSKAIVAAVICAFSFAQSCLFAVTQCQSTAWASGGTLDDGEEFILQNGSDITMSTPEQPVPNCPDDTADGDPYYWWSFGSLTGWDNGDSTATVSSEVEGQGHIQVICYQDYFDADGNSYTVQTQQSTN